jgi:protocatechuate 3,4-dioxygenase beta subunit
VTPSQTEGPFHPANRDNDLTRKDASSPVAQGQIIYITGTVLDENANPLSGALIEIWQAAANGKYNHPGDPNPKPVDPHFQYWGREISDDQGNYVFKTIIPGHYPATPTWTRPAHVHFRVLRRGFRDLTTQMYFTPKSAEERELLEKDLLLQELSPAEQAKLIVEFSETPAGSNFESGSLTGNFVIELKEVKQSTSS